MPVEPRSRAGSDPVTSSAESPGEGAGPFVPATPRSVLIVTDAWHPQVNGVVQSIEGITTEMTARGIRVELITPNEFRTVPMPGYPEIALSITRPGAVYRRIESAGADVIHIATEGPLGLIARRWCVRNNVAFSTAYHTEFPEYLRARLPIPLALTYAVVRWFHRPATRCLVGTSHLKALLEQRGFRNVAIWPKGVDSALFHPARKSDLGMAAPVFLYVGRVSVEKNIEAFLQLELPGTKVVVGGGPSLAALSAAHTDAVFAGPKSGEELARYYASADVFVFPSRTDTFGLVMIEALASGTPVAAFPTTGPIDVIGSAPVGVLDEDLGKAALAALKVSRDACREYALGFSWSRSADAFLANQAIASPPLGQTRT